MSDTEEKEQPWYKDGLGFQCTQCGDCCTGAPGYVWINAAEIAFASYSAAYAKT